MPTAPATPGIDIAKALTRLRGASAKPSRPGRSFGFRAIAATTATARSKTADQYDETRGDEFGCAPAPQFGGAARSLPTATLFGFGVRFARPGPFRLSAPRCTAGYRQPTETTNELARIRF